jgi:hypothetical protein
MFWPCETQNIDLPQLRTISSGFLFDVKDIPQVGPLEWGRIRGAPEGFETAIIEPTSPPGYGEGATLIMGVVAPVITAVLAVPRSKFFNVKALMAVEIGSLAVALINLT